ncbi:MAG: hypothetical protein IAI49_12400, partial [Candidatus Eremiobacteraeota bacterium]|nr:hypothetical protein [Candidatus Eremiobacteraeota bacterium]
AHPGADVAALVDARASELLPDYARPSLVVPLIALPLTANGKLDRRALGSVALSRGSTAAVAPRTPTEFALAAIWAECFKREPASFGVRDDFFGLGGHSLLAIRVLGKIGREFGARLSLRDLFDAPTVERLAAVLDAARKGAKASGSISAVSRSAYRVAASPTASGDGTS